mmetsp:Transcript_3792/g.4356  ORF Transcript_3792/g.4356 Transcript_3792/m.4356 type:complete len:106 (+) Transcript_3792:283-600(+)
MGEKPIASAKPSDVSWSRAYNVFAPRGRTLFGDGISTDDVNQGSLGNCWFLAGASAIAEFPGRMEKVFLTKDNALNEQGVYAVQFWKLNVPHTVVIDDFLPLRTN